jgi:hypothetical protein
MTLCQCAAYDVRIAAYVLLSLDACLFVAWIVVGFFPVMVQCGVALYLHPLILLHFGQAAAVASALDTWNTSLRDHTTLDVRPYTWIVASLVSIWGDIFLLISEFVSLRPPECENSRYAHIIIDACGAAICGLSIVWFLSMVVMDWRQRHQRRLFVMPSVSRTLPIYSG